VDDWLEGGLPGRSERTRSIYREALTPLLDRIGSRPLKELTARDVRKGLDALGDRLSTRYLQIARASLSRAIRYAEAHDLVGRNVATLVDAPKGQMGRPSRSLSLEQSLALLQAAQSINEEKRIALVLRAGGIQQGRNIALYQFSGRRPYRGDSPPGWPQPHCDNGARLPP
jgi:hypothetical protein